MESCLCWTLSIRVVKCRKSRQDDGHTTDQCYFGSSHPNTSTASHRPAVAELLPWIYECQTHQLQTNNIWVVFTLQWVTGMGVLLGRTCMLVLLTQSQEYFSLSTFAFQCSLADQRLCLCLVQVFSIHMQVPGCCCTEQSCYRRITCAHSSVVSSFSWIFESHWAVHLFPFLPVLPAQYDPNGCCSDNYRHCVFCRLPEPVWSSKHKWHLAVQL